ncbi:MAG: ABC transporter ATP-binding protein [Lachnospiraceae bacterium]|nr:ABC transporter ATP-binding protein [Lachnospiraceae bacterium]
MLEVKNLKVSFDDSDEVVHGIDFEIGETEIVGIIGESGSGKSVTALSCIGLLKDNATCTGEIIFKGKDLNKLSDEERRAYKGTEITQIFQEPLTSLNPVLTIWHQLEEPLILHRKNMSPADRKKRVLQAMQQVGLNDPEELLDCYPHELSGGMRQRVMIAIGIICHPSLMIADEPTTALDVNLQDQILALLKRISRDHHMSIMFISHNMSIVRNFCDRVYVMHKGNIVETGTPDEIFFDPKEDYTKKLIGSIPNGKLREDSLKGDEKTILKVEDFSVFYKQQKKRFYEKTVLKEVVKKVSFELHEGEMAGLVGRSGCGKSTLSLGLLGLLKITKGSVFFEHDGKKINMLDRHADKHGVMQMVFQDPYGSLNPKKKIGWILAEPLRMKGELKTSAERKQRVHEVLQEVGLDVSYSRRYPSDLSGGQRQRVCIAVALIQGARLIIADEPVSALDVTVQKQILELILDIQRRTGIAVLFISHDMNIVRQMCHRIFHMTDGKLNELTPEEVSDDIHKK